MYRIRQLGSVESYHFYEDWYEVLSEGLTSGIFMFFMGLLGLVRLLCTIVLTLFVASYYLCAEGIHESIKILQDTFAGTHIILGINLYTILLAFIAFFGSPFMAAYALWHRLYFHGETVRKNSS